MSEDVLVVRSLRELDALVAEHLFGWKWYRPWSSPQGRARAFIAPEEAVSDRDFERLEKVPDKTQWDTNTRKLWDYWLPYHSTWSGLELLVSNREEAGFQWTLGGINGADLFGACLWPKGSLDDYGEFSSEHPSVPIAFCLAALASVGCNVRLELGE